MERELEGNGGKNYRIKEVRGNVCIIERHAELFLPSASGARYRGANLPRATNKF